MSVDNRTTFTVRQRTEICRAFDAGNYANVYKSSNLDDHNINEMSAHERAAFVLGFFSSYGLREIGAKRKTFVKCYRSDVGRAVIAAGYCDERTEVVL